MQIVNTYITNGVWTTTVQVSLSGDSNYSFSKEHYCIYICNIVAICENDIVLLISSFMGIEIDALLIIKQMHSTY